LDAFSPICPFFSHHISSTLYERSAVEAESFPILPEGAIDDGVEGWLSITDAVMEFNSEIWRVKKEQGLSLNSELTGIEIPNDLDSLSIPLSRMHRLG
jgi:valyl-tRNA synthetase